MPKATIETTMGIVAGLVSHNSVRPEDLTNLIKDIYAKLIGFEGEAPSAEAPPASWKKTIQNEYLVSLEDGKRYKTLKRHLSALGMTPNDYREKWSLPKDYPLVCKDYSKRRSEISQTYGLRRKPKASVETVI